MTKIKSFSPYILQTDFMNRIILLACLLTLAGCVETTSTGSAALEPEQSGSMAGVSSKELAQGYEAAKSLLLPLEFAAMGGTVVTPGGEITAGNAARIKRETEGRIAAYRREIERRGSVNIGGRYRADTTEPCTRVPSWIAFISQGAQSFEFRQRGFEFELLQTNPRDNRVNKMTGVIVGSDFVFTDSLNSDFRFNGTASSGTLIVKPDPAVLKSWPDWAGPPSRRDISSCVVTFSKL